MFIRTRSIYMMRFYVLTVDLRKGDKLESQYIMHRVGVRYSEINWRRRCCIRHG